LLAVGALIWLTGCASIGPPLPPSLELPKPPSDLRATRKGDKITLTWTIPARTTDRQSLRYLGKTRVCRIVDAALATCGAPLGEVVPPADFAEKKAAGGQKAMATYLDILSSRPHVDASSSFATAFATATYAVEVLNPEGRGAGLSNQVHMPLGETLWPPADFAAGLTEQGVVLSWSGEMLPPAYPQAVHFGYRVYRRLEGSQQSILAGEVAAGGARNLSITDKSFEWEKTYYYRAESFTVISQAGKPDVSVEGDDSPEVKVFTHDVFPPGVPSGLQAVFSGPGQLPFIDLIWAPANDADLGGYNVYRHEEGGAAVKVNSELVKAPAFRDAQVVSGRTYFYSVSAVDLRGNESGRSEEASERVP